MKLKIEINCPEAEIPDILQRIAMDSRRFLASDLTALRVTNWRGEDCGEVAKIQPEPAMK